jgi:signal recognition particle subunit SRP54
MALSALGSKISAALGSLMHTETVDDETIGAALKDIGNALMEADVNIKLVMQLRKNVLARISSDAGPAVFDKVRNLCSIT